MKSLGIDIQDHVVRAVEMESRFGRLTLGETFSEQVPSPEMKYAIAAGIIARFKGPIQKVVTALPLELATIRNLTIASKDRKTVLSALEFELEDELPFEKEHLVFDSSILSTTKQTSEVHILATRRDRFQEFLGKLAEGQFDPEIITSRSWALASAIQQVRKANQPKLEKGAEPPPEFPDLIIEIRDQETFLSLIHQQRPVVEKSVGIGLRHFQQALMNELKLSEADAYSWCKEMGMADHHPEAREIILRELDPLVLELKQMELSARAATRMSIAGYYFVGESALMPGLLDWAEQNSGRPAHLLRPLQAISHGKLSYSDLSESEYAVAIGLAIVGTQGSKPAAINLRKGEFAKLGAENNEIQRALIRSSPFLAITLAVFFSVQTVKVLYYQKKNDMLSETLKKNLKNYFSGISDSALRNRMAEMSKLKSQLQADADRKKDLEQFMAAQPVSPGHVLRDLSSKIGQDLQVEMLEFKAGQATEQGYKFDAPVQARVAFKVENPQVEAKLVALLDKQFQMKKLESREEGKKIRVTFSK